ncbi:MAG: hypothetical protein L0H23_13595, partial [Luteimonas sp.]|nr:hypothetical protein [Luteimonas sp.]
KPYWPGHPSLIALQHREPSHLKQVSQPENLGLMGMPERHARPSWLAPSQRRMVTEPNDDTPDDNDDRPSPELTHSSTAVGNRDNGSPQLPLWLQAAVRLGTRFLRIAAAGGPPATSSFKPSVQSVSASCAECGRVHPPVMDEYYFWLVKSEYHDPGDLNPDNPSLYQDADWGVAPPDMTSDWHRREQLPQLLRWPKRPMVRLAWCRVHNGEFQTPRYSDDGAHLDPDGAPAQLEFLGREGDSLRFRITNAAPPPAGHTDPSPWGFRYDIATDTAVVLPEVVKTLPAPEPFPPPLPAYPFFVFFTPGAPLEPSIYSTAMTVAATLRAHCRHEAALKWYELYFAPGDKDLRWATCRTPQEPTPDDDVPDDSTQPDPGRPHANVPTDPAEPVEPDTSVIVTRSRTDQDPCCDTLVRTDLASRRRSVVLAYLETLLEHAKAAMCKHSPEGYAMTRLRLDTLAEFLGERPRTIFGQDDGTDPQAVTGFVPRFAPLNPRLMKIYGDVTDDLEALHHCLTKARL